MMDVLTPAVTCPVLRALRVLALGLTALWFTPQAAMAEGSVQLEFGQRLLDYQAAGNSTNAGDYDYAIDDASAVLFVDVLNANEVINVSLCGAQDSDDVGVEIYDESVNLVFSDSQTSGTLDC
ncbi:MAG: hypothetical protein RIA65_05795, partial [Woeseia sp.]